MKNIVSSLQDNEGQIIFEYDIPRLGKRIDVVLLCRGIVFCLEFKVGESKILEMDYDVGFTSYWRSAWLKMGKYRF